MFALLFAFTRADHYAGMTFGCYGKGTFAEMCDKYKVIYEDKEFSKQLEEMMKELTGEKVTVDINFESIKSDKDAGNFPSKVKSTSLTAVLMSFLPIKKENPLDLTKLDTECFFTATASDLSFVPSVTLDKEKLMKKTAKVLMAKTMEDKAKYTTKLTNTIRGGKSPLKEMGADLYIKAPSKCSKNVLMLVAVATGVSFVGNCEVNLYYVDPASLKSDSGLIKSPYLITDRSTLARNSLLKKSAPLNDVAILDVSSNIYKVNFIDNGWEFGSYEIPKSLIGGQLSIIQITINVVLYTSGSYTTVQSINISASGNYVNANSFSSMSLKAAHSVKFDGNWDVVTNKPKIIVEAEDPSAITIIGEPSTVTVEKVKYEPKVKGKKKKVDVGMIVGVVIGVLAFVAIVAGVCVYFFVIKPKKAASNSGNDKAAVI